MSGELFQLQKGGSAMVESEFETGFTNLGALVDENAAQTLRLAVYGFRAVMLPVAF
jgi:hypothetical protein